eukprot:1501592-Prymnesium_polylepis.1
MQRHLAFAVVASPPALERQQFPHRRRARLTACSLAAAKRTPRHPLEEASRGEAAAERGGAERKEEEQERVASHACFCIW